MVDTPKKLTDEDISKAVAQFKIPRKKADKIIDAMKPQPGSVTIEERQFGVSGEARDDFARLYDAEIARIGKCPLVKIGKPRGGNAANTCNIPLMSFQHFLVHHQIHLMLTADSRVQKQTNAQALDLVYPMSEKTMRAALGPDERKRMLRDPQMIARIAKRRELAS